MTARTHGADESSTLAVPLSRPQFWRAWANDKPGDRCTVFARFAVEVREVAGKHLGVEPGAIWCELWPGAPGEVR